MDRRKRIGIVYHLVKTWMAGAYYIEHILKTCATLPENEQPSLLVYYNNDEAKSRLEQIDYAHLELQKINFPKRAINKACLELFGLTPISIKSNAPAPDVVYPYIETFGLNDVKDKYFWIPDFQDHYYPELFPAKELRRRSKLYNRICKSPHAIVFSSKNAMDDFKKFYPKHENDLHLLRFASLPPAFDHLDIDELKMKFNIQKPYFIVCNQFWQHKNHQLVLEAIAQLESKALEFEVVFTGSPNDPRNMAHFETLQTYIDSKNISSRLKMLGFIDRSEQLQLMNHAVAVVQPSLFEGWSTVVEDAKALNQFIIVSNIAVHQEQIQENCSFFDPHNAIELAEKIEDILINKPELVKKDYSENVKQFAKDFIGMFDAINT